MCLNIHMYVHILAYSFIHANNDIFSRFYTMYIIDSLHVSLELLFNDKKLLQAKQTVPINLLTNVSKVCRRKFRT
jgi:hypothetical protein